MPTPQQKPLAPATTGTRIFGIRERIPTVAPGLCYATGGLLPIAPERVSEIAIRTR